MRVSSIRTFNEQDWYLLGGAEKFTDNRGPFIADDFEYGDMIAIADINGLQILINGEEYHLSIVRDNLSHWDSALAEEFFRIFVGSISGLTDEEAALYCKGIGFRSVLSSGNSKICPICGRKYTEPPALSRRDNSTQICPQCGTAEAIEDYFNSPEAQGGSK